LEYFSFLKNELKENSSQNLASLRSTDTVFGINWKPILELTSLLDHEHVRITLDDYPTDSDVDSWNGYL